MSLAGSGIENSGISFPCQAPCLLVGYMNCTAAQHTCEELWEFYRQDDSLFQRVLRPLETRNIVPLQTRVPAETGCA